jgi:hypothetical protein
MIRFFFEELPAAAAEVICTKGVSRPISLTKNDFVFA